MSRAPRTITLGRATVNCRCHVPANPHQTLGVQKDASQDEIQKAYRQLAKKLPPDRTLLRRHGCPRFQLIRFLMKP